MRDITKVKVPGPRQLRPVGTGALWGEQQYCYEKGYREGVAAAREAIREVLLSSVPGPVKNV